MKHGAGLRGESQLSFALLFMSIRAFSDKKNYPKFFAVCGGGGTSNLQGGAIFALTDVTLTISDTKFERNTANFYVSEILSFS